MNIGKIMKQAQQMQAQLQRELEQLSVEASSGGGMVTVVMSGNKLLSSVTIDPEILDPEDPEMVQDLVLAAVNQAAQRVDEALQDRVGAMTGGLGLPGLP